MRTQNEINREQIKKDTEAFLAAGNEIKRLKIRQVQDLKKDWNRTKNAQMEGYGDGI